MASKQRSYKTAVASDASTSSGIVATIIRSSLCALHHELIIALAARHRLPTVYPYRYHVSGGGLRSPMGPMCSSSIAARLDTLIVFKGREAG